MKKTSLVIMQQELEAVLAAGSSSLPRLDRAVRSLWTIRSMTPWKQDLIKLSLL